MDELAKHFAELAEKYGPTVYNAGLEATRIEIYSTIVAALLQAVMASVLWYLAYRLFLKVWKEDWDDFTYVPIALSCLFALSLSLFAIWTFIDPWTWTALNHPELWLAKKAMHL